MNEQKVLYIEATSGISGDMFLGCLMDLGVPYEIFQKAWDSLSIENYEVEVFETEKSGMRALQCRVKTEESRGPRNWKQYQKLIKDAALSANLKDDAYALVKKLFQLEAAVHKTTIEKLALHEMGGTDLLIDIIGVLIGIDHLKPSRIVGSPVNTGHGFLRFSHGQYPVPAPVTTRLLEGYPIFQNQVSGELTTPTGALLITHLAKEFGPLPKITLDKMGVGAGEREITGHPNVLRLFLGREMESVEKEEGSVVMVETNIDDANPQILAYFMERALQEGAMDVFFTPIVMKKNRPGVRVSLLVDARSMQSISELLFSETTAIGFRYWHVDRSKLERRWKNVRMDRQPIRIKESYMNGRLYNFQPEYEDCKLAAQKLKKPVKQILAEAIHLYLSGKK